MLPEAGAFELIFLAAVALIVVGPKDLPILLRKVGQWTAKMRGLAAEFRASFDEMARQSELDELRKEVEALRTGQFAAGAKPDVESHLADINGHLNDPYWGASSHADTADLYSDASAEGAETAALPPPGSRTPALPKKLRSAAEATGSQDVDAVQEPATPKAPRAPRGAKPKALSEGGASTGSSPKPPRKAAAKKPSPNQPAPEAAEI